MCTFDEQNIGLLNILSSWVIPKICYLYYFFGNISKVIEREKPIYLST